MIDLTSIKEKCIILKPEDNAVEVIKENPDMTVIRPMGPGYAQFRYAYLHNGANLSAVEIALVCDDGDLRLGFRVQANLITVFTG